MELNKFYKKLPDGSFVEFNFYEYQAFSNNHNIETPWFLIVVLILCVLGIIILSL